jgi:hypothetical protein
VGDYDYRLQASTGLNHIVGLKKRILIKKSSFDAENTSKQSAFNGARSGERNVDKGQVFMKLCLVEENERGIFLTE